MNSATRQLLSIDALRAIGGGSLDYIRYNSYRSERHKILYVATPKVACTSLKWWFASLEGHDQELRIFTDSVESAPELVIHDGFYRVAPKVTHLDLDVLLDALDSTSYFRFALVRNPYKRLFSAWQSKVLLMEPYQVKPYLGCDFIHHRVECASDIAAAFEAFLEHLGTNEAPNYLDAHWTPQMILLRPDLIDYSRLAKIEAQGDLFKAMELHVGDSLPNPFSSQPTNESLIPYLSEFVTERSANLIRSLYAADFETFEYDEDPPKTEELYTDDQLGVALKAIALLRGRHQRLGERNGKINYLNQAIAERVHEIARLSSSVTVAKKPNTVLTELVPARDNELGAYRTQADEFTAQIALLQTGLSEAAAEVANLTSALRESEARRTRELSNWKFLAKQMSALIVNAVRCDKKSTER